MNNLEKNIKPSEKRRNKLKKMIAQSDAADRRHMIVAVLVVTFMMIVAVVLIVETINQSLYSEREQYMSEITKASSETINESIAGQYNQARWMKNVVENMIPRSGDIEQIMPQLSRQLGMDKNMFFVVDTRGRYYSSDGKSGEITNPEFLAYRADDEVQYIASLPHLNPEKTYLISGFRLQKPLKATSKGERITIEYFASMNDLGKLDATISGLFEGENNTFIFETDSGRILYQQFGIGEMVDGLEMYAKFSQVEIINGRLPDVYAESCRQEKTVVIEMRIEGEYYYFCSTPLDVSNWSLAFVIKKDHITDAAGNAFNDIINAIIVFALLVVIAVIILAGMFMNARANRRIRKNLEQVNTTKTSFLFNMSHDIRTPLNAIIGFTDMALRNLEDKARVEDCLKKTQLSGDILLALINDILEFSRIESGHVTINRTNENILEMFEETETVLKDMADRNDIELVFETGEIRDVNVRMDKTRCQRVLINVISNGIKYTPAGGRVKVSLAQEQAEGQMTPPQDQDRLTTTNEQGLYRFVIEDNGIGMSDEFQEHLFEEFTREENTTTSGVQGTGLGLALCKSIVDLLGGTIECKSRQREGSVFTITFPFEILSEEELGNLPEEIIPDEINLEGCRALVVEDIYLNREIAEDLLGDMGITVDSAENGQIALDVLREKGISFYDFILMDIQMPVMDGYEAVREIRRLFPESSVPVIALSANAFEEDRQKSKEAGMDAHIAKPIDVNELKSVLARHRRQG